MQDTVTAAPASAPPEVTAAWNVELSIRGMTCAACAARIEKKLTRLDPAVVAAVSLATERAVVSAPRAITEQALLATIEGLGYTAAVVPPAGSALSLTGGDAESGEQPRLAQAAVAEGRVVAPHVAVDEREAIAVDERRAVEQRGRRQRREGEVGSVHGRVATTPSG